MTVYLPMAWDRYQLPIQSGNALLAARGRVGDLGPARPVATSARRDEGLTGAQFLGRPAAWVFLILLASNAFFWHSRDWNTASRLMLTYALVDRGTVIITGLEQQTGDRARFQGQYYSDKLPGFSLLAAVPYAIARLVFGLPTHPLRAASSVLGGRLLGHPVHLRLPDGRDRRPPHGLVARAGLSRRSGRP